MTLEERQLLLMDISARLPYGVHVHFCNTNIDEKLTEISLGETITQIRHNGRGNQGLVKPYLRPMSSMTEEETYEYDRLVMCNASWVVDDWLNKKMFDYRGLIPMFLALEAPKGMYKFK